MSENIERLVNAHGEEVGEKRNLAYSAIELLSLPTPAWSTWTVSNAVREGMRVNNWVYRCVTLIADSFKQLPFRVRHRESGEWVNVRAVDALLKNPSPEMSRQDCFELIAQWLLLAGRAYMWYDGRNLVPVSPDRLSPVRSDDIGALLQGYAELSKKGEMGQSVKYKPEEIISFLRINPADPVSGASPLEAAGKFVDIDNEQADFNKAAMQNRGEFSGFIALDERLTGDQMTAYAEKVNQRHSGAKNARRIGVIGAGAKYQRIGATPVEMDFERSAIINRDKIISAFGVPPQMVGATEASTYDNFRTAELVLWRNAVLPLAEDVADSLTFFFSRRRMIDDGLEIKPDLSGIPVLQEQISEKSKTAETLYKIGVPVEQISTILKLGIEQFDGWALPWNGGAAVSAAQFVTKDMGTIDAEKQRSGDKAHAIETRAALPWRTRDIEAERRSVETEADALAPLFFSLLEKQRAAVDALIDAGAETVTAEAVAAALDETRAAWTDALASVYAEQARIGASQIVIQKRAIDPALDAQLADYFAQESIILREKSLIDASTVAEIALQVRDGVEQGLSTQAIKQSIQDAGVFSAMRSLRLARTIAGTAQSVGQWFGAKNNGATIKVWSTASDGNVRDKHQNRAGDEAPIDGVFNIPDSAGYLPRFPLDPGLVPAERCNCRCSMFFKVE